MARRFANQHYFGLVARLLAYPQRHHGGTSPHGEDQIRPWGFQGIAAAVVEMIQGGPVTRLAQYKLGPHVHVFVLYRPRQRVDDGLDLAVIAPLVTENHPGTRCHVQASALSWQ